MSTLFSEEQKQKIRNIGPHGLMIKMAEYDGYPTPETFSTEKRLLSILGQKYMTKKASMKIINLGLSALDKCNE